MARSFASASSEYLEDTAATPPATAYPLSMACFFQQTSVAIAAVRSLISLQDKDTANNWFNLQTQVDASVNKYIRADTRSGAGWDQAIASLQFSVNTWHHAAGVWTNATSRAVYLDGSNKGTNATNVTPANIDSISIGRTGDSSPGNYFEGDIAGAAIWEAALTDAEIASLAAGAHPLTIRPQSLVFYAPLWRDEDEDYVGGISLTAFNTPSIATHNKNYYGLVMPHIGFTSAGAGPAGLSIPVAMYDYRRRRVA